MSLASFTLKKVDLAASAVFFALAVFVMIEGAKLGAGWDQRGPEAGFFPFWLAVLMAFGAIAAFIQGVRKSSSAPFFEKRQEVVDLAKVGAPLVAVVVAMPWLGIYITTLLYIWLFAWWYGGFKWWTSLLGGLCASASMYFTFVAMKLPMPTSVFYEKGILPF